MNIVYISILLAILVLPGSALVLAAGISRYRYLIAIAASYVAFAILLLTFRLLDLSVLSFSGFVIGAVTVAALIGVYDAFKHPII